MSLSPSHGVWPSIVRFFLPEGGGVRKAAYALLCAVGLILGLAVSLWSVGQRVEWTLYDAIARAVSAGAPAAPGIVVVAIDEPSVAELGQPLPWPRSVHAALIDALSTAGARVIGLDLLFDLPGSTEQDETFRAAIQRAGNVVLIAQREDLANGNYSLVQWSEPLPELAEVARGVGVARMGLDPDGVVRHARLRVDGRDGFALAVAKSLGEPEPPATTDRPFLVRFNGASRLGIQTVSYYQALRPDTFLPRDFFRDKAVLVGFSLAASAAVDAAVDHYATPVDPQMAGVEIQASVLDTILRDRAVRDPFAAWPIQALGCGVLGVLMALFFFRVGPLTGFVATTGFGALCLAAAYGAMAGFGVRVPILPPALSMAGLYALTAAYRFGAGQRERRFLKRAFQHYVSPAVVNQILSDPSRLQLGGEEYDVTILFADLADFTSIAERLTPAQVRNVLHDYFSEMTNVLLAEGATLDKFIGDAIMAFFGCPVPSADHAEAACRAALGMRDRLAELNRERHRQGLPELRMRIGLHSGRVVAGNVGTDTIFNYTVLGDAVNLASRLEGVNKEYGTSILVSEATRTLAGDRVEAREIDRVTVKGKADPTSIFELATRAGELSEEREELFRRFAAGLQHYRAREWSAAGTAFEGALALDDSDGPSLCFLQRCDAYAVAPPPETWAGVHGLTKK